MTKFYIQFSESLRRLKDDERGVTAIEYGLIAVAMAVLLGVALGDTGFLGSLSTAFGNVATEVAGLEDGGAAAPTP